jgi:hypothetical protein
MNFIDCAFHLVKHIKRSAMLLTRDAATLAAGMTPVRKSGLLLSELALPTAMNRACGLEGQRGNERGSALGALVFLQALE